MLDRFGAATLAVTLLSCGAAQHSPAPPLHTVESPNSAAKQLVLAAQQARQALPQEAATLYILAQAYAENKQPERALQTLEELVKGGWDLGLAESDFVSIATRPQYRQLLATVTARIPTVGAHIPVAFRLPERDLIPEGIAYAAEHNVFFVGSIHKHKIVRIEANGKVTDFVRAGEAGLCTVLGIKVDAARHALWAVSDPAADCTQASAQPLLLRFNLISGVFEAAFSVAPTDATQAPFFNDLVVGTDGSVFVTATDAGGVLVLRPGNRTLTWFLPPHTLLFPNGIALEPDSQALLIADAVGILRVDPQTGKGARLSTPVRASLGGIDGLAWHDTGLIAVQNGFSEGRVIRLRLDAKRQTVTAVEILVAKHPLFNIPTTLAVAQNAAFVIANSQLRSKDAQGHFLPAAQLQETAILKLPLN